MWKPLVVWPFLTGTLAVMHPPKALATGCLLEIGDGQQPHGIGHLQLDDVTTRHLGALVQQHGGEIGRRDEHNLIIQQ